MNKEFIICAAIWINDGEEHSHQPVNIKTGYVIAGRRHHNCYQTIKSLTGQTPNEKIGELIKAMSPEDIKRHQGFITSFDRFVDRRQAWKIAKANNQIRPIPLEDCPKEEQILISENLY